MKIILQILTCAALLFAVGCGKDDNGDGGGGTTENDKLIEQISAKWNINSSSYVSLELNKSGNYIVVKNLLGRATSDDFEVIFGVYKVLNTTTIELVDFGKIAINSISSTALSVNLTVNGTQAPIPLSGQKVDNSTDIPASAKTELLCRTWEVTTVDGVDISQIPDDEDGSVATGVYFSAAGTYLLSLRDGGTDLSSWKWFDDASQDKIYYSWMSPPVWDEDGEGGGTVEITTLTSSKLVITEQLSTGPSVVELKPATTPKSSTTATYSTAKSAKQAKGFWGMK